MPSPPVWLCPFGPIKWHAPVIQEHAYWYWDRLGFAVQYLWARQDCHMHVIPEPFVFNGDETGDPFYQLWNPSAARYADLGQWIVWSQEYQMRGFSQLYSSDQGWGLPINCEVRIFPSPLGASLSLISKITFRRRAGIPSFAVRFIRWHISVLVVFGGWWRMVEV